MHSSHVTHKDWRRSGYLSQDSIWSLCPEFGGMRDSAFFRRDIRSLRTGALPSEFFCLALAEIFFRPRREPVRRLWYSGFELKTGAGSGNYYYEREWDFVFPWAWDAGFTRGPERDTGFQFLRDLINWPAQKPQVGQKWTFCAYSCVRFQVMYSNGSVPCQVLSNVSIIAWLR